jgi:hypothetical protein
MTNKDEDEDDHKDGKKNEDNGKEEDEGHV